MSRFSLLAALTLVTATLSAAPLVASADRISPDPIAAGPRAMPAAMPVQRPARRMPPVSIAQVRTALAAHRKANLVHFHAYARAGVYPSNTFQPGALDVWRDDAGHFCAAATMIRTSGEIDLVDRVADQDNFIHLADVTNGPVMDWMLTSGLTQAEIAMIQEPMMDVRRDQRRDPAARTAAISARKRALETKRLARRYRVVEEQLAAAQKPSLDRAARLLMETRPDLAATLVRG